MVRVLFKALSSAALALAGCTHTGVTLSGSKPPAPGAVNGLKTAAKETARNFVMTYATDELDAWTRSYFEESAGDALRTLEMDGKADRISEIAPAVRNVLNDWLPDRMHWPVFTDQVINLISDYVQEHPGNPNAVNEALEQVAQGLQAVNARPSTSL